MASVAQQQRRLAEGEESIEPSGADGDIRVADVVDCDRSRVASSKVAILTHQNVRRWVRETTDVLHNRSRETGVPRDDSVMVNGYRAEHSFAIVLIEVMVKATDAGPVLAGVEELVLSEGDSFPVTSTCCPR
jgi:hypothetical protein